jgi:HSP20 family protein
MSLSSFNDPSFVNSLRRMERDIDHLFGEVYSDPISRGKVTTRAKFDPAVDIYEKDGTVHVLAEIPGIPKDKVDIEIHENVLTLSGENERSKEWSKEHTHFQERNYGKFQRKIVLPEGVNGDGAAAAYDHGVLHIKIPKSVPNPSKKIPIK